MYDNLKKASRLFIIFGIIVFIPIVYLWIEHPIDAPEISSITLFDAGWDLLVNACFAVIPIIFFYLSKIFWTLAEDLQAQNITSEERLQKIKAELLKEIEAKAGQNWIPHTTGGRKPSRACQKVSLRPVTDVTGVAIP